MPSFRSSAKQVDFIMRQFTGVRFKNVAMTRVYETSLIVFCDYLKNNRLGDLRSADKQLAYRFLEQRKKEVKQSTLDTDRRAIQCMMQYVTHELDQNEILSRFKSELSQARKSYAYTPEQVSLVVERQTERNALSTEIAYNAGLKAHELLTIRPIEEQPADKNPTVDHIFEGSSGQRWTVTSIGGVTREIVLSIELSEKLQHHRLEKPEQVIDREMPYTKYYDISGGNAWSASFTRASKRAIFKSNGAHGLRHSYAQERMDALQGIGYLREHALEAVSQEMGLTSAYSVKKYLN